MIGLKVLPIQVHWAQSICYMGTRTLRDRLSLASVRFRMTVVCNVLAVQDLGVSANRGP